MSAEATSAVVTPLPAPMQPGAVMNDRDLFELALRKSKVYASSTLVPQQYQGNLANCLIALNMSKRIGADELMVMQNLHIVQGKPGWSGVFLIATFNQCGRFSAMRFEWRSKPGEKDWGCRAYATEHATGEKIVGAWIDWKMVEAEGWSKKNGSKWLTMPEQMFVYRAGAFLVKAYAPEIAMGLQTTEELRDVIDIEPEPTKPAAADAIAAINAQISGTTTAATVDTEQNSAIDTLTEPTKPASKAPTPAEVGDLVLKAKSLDELQTARSLIAFDDRTNAELSAEADRVAAGLGSKELPL